MKKTKTTPAGSVHIGRDLALCGATTGTRTADPVPLAGSPALCLECVALYVKGDAPAPAPAPAAPWPAIAEKLLFAAQAVVSDATDTKHDAMVYVVDRETFDELRAIVREIHDDAVAIIRQETGRNVTTPNR